jgi:prephenate dehydratase/chorismate mutase/prephenate dehydratase
VLNKSTQKSQVAYLGPSGSFSSVAALKMAGNDKNLLKPQKNSLAVVYSVLDDKMPLISSGVLPIENNVAGFVCETFDLLLENDILIVDSIHLPISFTAYCLPSVDNSSTKFRVVRAHPHALSQCSKFIQQYNLVPLAALSNSQAVFDLDDESFALAPTQSPEFDNYKSFEHDVQDYLNGKTQFVKIVESKPLMITSTTTLDDLQVLGQLKPDRVVIVITPKINRVGALYEILLELYNGLININSLISRPIKGVDDLYSFFLTLETSIDCNLLKVLKAIENTSNSIRILGGYVDSKN